MSIYATLWSLRFPKDGDDVQGCEWVTIIAQGVPSHIGASAPGLGYEDGDPYGAFLPPPVPTDAEGRAVFLRAVVFVRERTPKGTARSHQEYVDPLLVMTGEAYARATFAELHSRLCDALRGDRPKVVLELFTPDGGHQTLRDDGTSEPGISPRTGRQRAKRPGTPRRRKS